MMTDDRRLKIMASTLISSRGLFSPQMSHVAPDPPRNQDHQRDSNHEIESVKKSLEHRSLVPFFAQLLTHISQAETPRQRSGEGVDNELFQIHPRDAGRERDECANDRKQTAGENNGFTKTSEPTIG